MNRFWQILFGHTAPEQKGRDLLFVVIPCLLADVVTKCLALWLLEGDGIHLLGGEVQLLLTINESLFAAGQHPSDFGFTMAMVFAAALMRALLASLGFFFGRADWTTVRKLTLMGVVIIVGSGVGLALGSLVIWEPHRLFLYALRACSSIAVTLLGLRLVRSRYLGMAFCVFLAGTLGNSMNALYYPRGIIDFIYVARLPYSFGVFNLADVELELGVAMILLSPIMLVLLRLLARKHQAWKHRLEYTNPTEPGRSKAGTPGA